MEKGQRKTEKDGRLEAGSSRRCWKGLEHVDLASLGRWAKGQSPSEGCAWECTGTHAAGGQGGHRMGGYN